MACFGVNGPRCWPRRPIITTAASASFLVTGILAQKPSPQVPVRGFFTAELDVKSALLQVIDLFSGEIDGATNRAVCCTRTREIENSRASHPGHASHVNSSDGGRRSQPF